MSPAGPLKLNPYLQANFFAGESAWSLLLRPLLWAAAAVLLLLAGRSLWPRRSRYEGRHGRRTKGPELLSALRWSRRAKADGIRFRLRFENALLGRLPFGPSYRIPRKLESNPSIILQTRKLLILITDKKDKPDTSPIVACKMHTKMRPHQPIRTIWPARIHFSSPAAAARTSRRTTREMSPVSRATTRENGRSSSSGPFDQPRAPRSCPGSSCR